MPDRPASPPEITQSFETGEGALTRFDRFPQPPGEYVDLSQTGFRISLYFIKTGARGEPRRLVAIIDCSIRPAAGKAVQEAAPVMPGRAAARVAGLLDEIANLVEGLYVLGMAAEGELDLGLLDDSVDTAHPVGFGVGQQVKAAERVVEIGQRLAVGPAALRCLGG